MTHSPDKIRIGILYGGRSAEHDVSIMSATNVLAALRPDIYDPVPIYITPEGKWLLASFDNGTLSQPSSGRELCLLPGGKGKTLALSPDGASHDFVQFDIIFPVLHGLHGEDGSIQGLAEVACVPLAGCGIAGSANALDKDLAKRLFNEAALPTANSLTIRRGQEPSFEELEQTLGLPAFIKPARQGSSVGVSKIVSKQDYDLVLAEGFQHDDKLLAEEFIEGREIECAILEDADGTLFVSKTGEIVPAEKHGFYTYEAKYTDADGAALIIPAAISPQIEDNIRAQAIKAFRALGCDGMARADFFVTKDERILVNELNTIPGFTNISMYSKVMEASGVSYPDILDRLISHGMARAEQAQSNDSSR